jgi:hypothetical protein
MKRTPQQTTSIADHWASMAVVAIVSMLAYVVVINHINLYPWNNLRLLTAEVPSTLAGVFPFSIYALAFVLRLRWLMLIGAVHSYVWLGLQIRQWWIPYPFGPTPLHSDFSWYFEHGYTETIKFLPSIPGRPAPDAEHVVQQLLLLFVVIATTMATLEAYRAHTPERQAAAAARRVLQPTPQTPRARGNKHGMRAED